MQLPQTVEVEGIRVLTTKQIAKEYGTNESAIRTNFSRNRTKFVERKHYIALTGDELRKFKDDITRCNAVKGNDITHCNAVGIRTNLLDLWTEKAQKKRALARPSIKEKTEDVFTHPPFLRLAV